MAIQFAEIIDRISITIPLTVPQLMQCNDQLWSQIKAKNATPTKIESGWRGTFTFEGDVSVGVSVAKLYGYRYLQYDLKPMEFDATMFADFVQLTSSFPGAAYAEALTKGTVSYLEVAVDFLFKDTSDVLIHKPGARTSYRYFPVNGTAPTAYVGAVKSASKSVAYTKATPKVLNGHTFNAQRVRVERRVRRLGLSPAELGGLKNLFTDVRVFSISAAECLTNHKATDWTQFLQKAKVVGVASALFTFPTQRKQLLALLGQCQVPWWRPSTYMTQWAQTVVQQLRLAPGID